MKTLRQAFLLVVALLGLAASLAQAQQVSSSQTVSAISQTLAVAQVSSTRLTALNYRRFTALDRHNVHYLLPIVQGGMPATGQVVTVQAMFRAQMGFVAARMTQDPTVPVPDYARCLQGFDGTERTMQGVCKLILSKMMQHFTTAKATNPNFMNFLNVYNLSQRNISVLGAVLKKPFTADELQSIASFHAYRLTQEKDAAWLTRYRTCIESASNTINCKNLKLEELGAALTLDYLKSVN